jgi:transposase
MRYELSDYEWAAIKPMLQNKPRGGRRINEALQRYLALPPIGPRTIAAWKTHNALAPIRTPIHAISKS